jgi:hypothetical protein
MVLGENRATETETGGAIYGAIYWQFDAWQPALPSSWDEAGMTGTRPAVAFSVK